MRSFNSRHARKTNRFLRPEMLEARTLLSAWPTVDTYQLSAGNSSSAEAMATDSAGNVYAAGQAMDSAGHWHGIVRKQAAGSSTWTTIEDYTVPTTLKTYGGAVFRAIAIDGAGDIYVAGYTQPSGTTSVWTVMEEPAGGTSFSVVDTLNNGVDFSLAVDQSGNVFAGGRTWATSTSKGKSTTIYTWTVRKLTAGQGVFSTGDHAISGVVFSGGAIVPGAFNATSIASGPSAGLYFVGLGSSGNWLVRKSTDAGATWTTVDNFVYSPNQTSSAQSVTGDGAGNIYVVGGGRSSTSEHWLVRKSTNGGSSWSTVDDFSGQAYPNAEAVGIGTDLTGNIYVVGSEYSGSSFNGIVRTNAGGSWETVNTMSSGDFSAFTNDTSGNLYAAGTLLDSANGNHWVVQSTQGPTASALAFSAQPASVIAGAAASPSFAVKVKTAGGATIVGDSSTVTLSILSGPAGGKLSGTFSAKANHGIAAFPNLRLTKAGTYRLKATDGKLAAASSASFKLVAAKPAKLAFIQQPPAGKVAKALSPAVTVAVQDNYGNVVASDHSTIKLSIDAGPAGAILSGVVSAADISGIAVFSNLRLSEAGTYKLKAIDGSDAAAISAAFKIS